MSVPKNIGVVGAGTMGSGIAQKIAQSGLPVVLMDIGEEQIQAGLDRIKKMLSQGVERKVFTPEFMQEVLGRITTTTEAKDMAGCDLIVEAVFEDMNIKRDIFTKLEQHVRADTVLATNTSSFKVSAIAQGAKHPERFIGLHYFFHPAKNRLLEVIPHETTSSKTLKKAWAFAEAHSKTAIHSEDAPGFVVNRFFVPWLTESVRLLQEGVADLPTIEHTCKELFGIGMGPFQLMNVTGVPIAMHAADGLASELGPFYKAADLLRKQVESGQNWPIEGKPCEQGVQLVRQRMLGVVLIVAAALVQEGVSSAEDVEIGAKVGLRWPMGPFSLANKHGIEDAVSAAASVARQYDLQLPDSIATRLKDPKPFEIRTVSMTVQDHIARITMNRPDALNALDPDTVADLDRAFSDAENDPEVKAIVIDGRGKAFVAGADIKFFVKNIDDKKIDSIVDFTRTGHELFLRIDKCKKPVVARLNGLALGGGLELALSCDAIVADSSAVMGFPETGIGIYPGLGGTQRTVHRCGLEVARYLVLTGQMISAKTAADLGLIDRVAPSGDTMTVVEKLLAQGSISAGPGAGELAKPVMKVMKPIIDLFNDTNTTAMINGEFSSDDKFAQQVAKKISQKAPVALKIAEQLMDQASSAPIEQGVEMELASLPEIFDTQDARTGLGSVGRARPEFKGK